MPAKSSNFSTTTFYQLFASFRLFEDTDFLLFLCRHKLPLYDWKYEKGPMMNDAVNDDYHHGSLSNIKHRYCCSFSVYISHYNSWWQKWNLSPDEVLMKNCISEFQWVSVSVSDHHLLSLVQHPKIFWSSGNGWKYHKQASSKFLRLIFDDLKIIEFTQLFKTLLYQKRFVLDYIFTTSPDQLLCLLLHLQHHQL